MDAMDVVEIRSETPSPPPLARHSMDLKELPPFPQRGFDADNSSSRIRSLSSPSILRKATDSFSPRPLSARNRNDVDESVTRELISACNALKESTSEPLNLPPLPIKPPSPEAIAAVANGGKIVRRRGLLKAGKTIERSPSSIGDSGSARGSSPASLSRRATVDGAAPIGSPVSLCRPLCRRATVDGVAPSRRLERSNSEGKLIRRRSLEDAPTTDKPPVRRRSIQSKDDLELAKIDAMKSLVASDVSGRRGGNQDTLAEHVARLTRNILKHHGTKAFTEDHVARAVERIHKEWTELERVDAVMQAIQYMAEAVNMSFSEVIGQILWRHKQNTALREKPRHKEVAEDISWAVECAEDECVGSDVLKAVDDVFDMLEAGQKGKGIGNKAWSRVVKFVEANPVLKRKINLCDVDRLWYAATHKAHLETPLKEIGRRAFKELLLTWCEAMGCHPWMVFVAVGSRANDADYADNWQKLWH